MKNLTYLTAILFLSVGLISCNQQAKDSTELADEYNSRDDTANFNTAVGPENQGDFDAAAFAVEAADGGMTEEQLGGIAQKNASSQAVKDFGQMMVTDHGKANKELIALAESKGIVLPTAPSQDQVKHIRDLNETTGAEFDKQYISMMVGEHKKTIELFEEAAEKATDPEIKAFAAKTLPVLKKHYAEAQSLDESLSR